MPPIGESIEKNFSRVIHASDGNIIIITIKYDVDVHLLQ
jgi:hypothetical protein